MSTSMIKPSLATLPPEILRMIITGPVGIVDQIELGYLNDDERAISITDSSPWRQKWSPIMRVRTRLQSTGSFPDYHKTLIGEDKSDDACILLRSLARTCRSLRAFAMPLLWSIVHVDSISELGRIRDILRLSPDIAKYIRCFCFLWNLDDPYGLTIYEDYPTSYGAILDMAFRDRTQMWKDLAQELGCEIERDPPESYFEINKGTSEAKIIPEPGQTYEKADYGPSDDGRWDYDAPRVGTHGPDGDGEDKRIKNAEDFNSCILEIVSKLSCLETFGWSSIVTPIPVEVFAVLANLSNLTSFHTAMSTHRNNLSASPLWNLARKLTHLSLNLDPSSHGRMKRAEGQFELELSSFELPSEAAFSRDAKIAIHFSIAARTIITAAKSGNLKSLRCSSVVQHAFAVRALLPRWVAIGCDMRMPRGMDKYSGSASSGWLGAATSLRPLLAHVSLWLGVAQDGSARQERTLTSFEVQALNDTLGKGLPKIIDTDSYGLPDAPSQPIAHYLPWLAEDEELSQRVADAWNAVVDRGQADERRCSCERCWKQLRSK